MDPGLALGYGYVETDAHVTRDGVLVAFHEERLDRVTDRTGGIAELSAADVEAADAGYTFSFLTRRWTELSLPRTRDPRPPP